MVPCLILFSLFQLNSEAKNLETVPLFVIQGPNPCLGEGHLTIHAQSSGSREATFDQAIERAASQNHTLIFFIEPILSMEDLSRKDSKGTSYYHLQNQLLGGKAIFFRNPLKPYQYLVKHFPLTPFNRLDEDFLKSNILPEMFNRSVKYFYVFFQDSSSGKDSRSEELRSHDIIINKMYSAMQHLLFGPVTGVYTGMLNPVILNSPQPVHLTADLNSTDYLAAVNHSARIYSCTTVDYCHAKLIVILSDTSTFHTMTNIECVLALNDKKDTVDLCTFKAEEFYEKGGVDSHISCVFYFIYREFPRKWVMDHVSNTCQFYGAPPQEEPVKTLYGETVIYNKSVPITHGYSSEAVFEFPTHTYTDQWFKKFSPTMRSLKNHKVYNDAQLMNYKDDKWVLFTAPIISGLIISGILVWIFLWSAGMMMNIQANTKFDNPFSVPSWFSEANQ